MEAAWKEYKAILVDVPAFLCKIRWQKPPVGPLQHSPRLRTSASSQSLSGTPPSSRTRRDSQQTPSRPPLVPVHGQLSGRKDTTPRTASASSNGSLPPATSPQFMAPAESPSRASIDSTSSAASTPVRLISHRHPSTPTNPGSPTALGPFGTPLSSMQSRAMLSQAHSLQLSSLSTRLSSLARSGVPCTTTTMDKILDCGLHVPEAFLDEQDEVEGALRSLMVPERIRFLAEVTEQWKAADEAWWKQRGVESEAEALARDVEGLLNKSPEVACAEALEELTTTLQERLVEIDTAYGGGEPTGSKAGRIPLPTFEEGFNDQRTHNIGLLGSLRLGYAQACDRLQSAKKLVATYRFSAETLSRAEALRRQIETSARNLDNLMTELRALPGRPDLSSVACLKPDAAMEAAYQVRTSKISADVATAVSETGDFFKRGAKALADLQRAGSDPNIRRDVREVMEQLRSRSEGAELFVKVRREEMELVRSVRNAWKVVGDSQARTQQAKKALNEEIEKNRWRPGRSPSEAVKRLSCPQIYSNLQQYLDDVRSATTLPSTQFDMSLVEISASFAHAADAIATGSQDVQRLDTFVTAVERQRVEVAQVDIEAETLEGTLNSLRRDLEHLVNEMTPGRGPLSEGTDRALSTLTDVNSKVQHFLGSVAARVPFLGVHDHLSTPFDPVSQDEAVRQYVNDRATALRTARDDVNHAADVVAWACSIASLDDFLNAAADDVNSAEDDVNKLCGCVQSLQSQGQCSVGRGLEMRAQITHFATSALLPPFLDDTVFDDSLQIVQQTIQTLARLSQRLSSYEERLQAAKSGDNIPEDRVALILAPRVDCVSKTRRKLTAVEDRLVNQSDTLRKVTTDNRTSREEHSLREHWHTRLACFDAEADRIGSENDTVRTQADDVRREAASWHDNFDLVFESELRELPPFLDPHERGAEALFGRLQGIVAGADTAERQARRLSHDLGQLVAEIESRLPLDASMAHESRQKIAKLLAALVDTRTAVTAAQDLVDDATLKSASHAKLLARRASQRDAAQTLLSSLDRLLADFDHSSSPLEHVKASLAGSLPAVAVGLAIERDLASSRREFSAISARFMELQDAGRALDTPDGSRFGPPYPVAECLSRIPQLAEALEQRKDTIRLLTSQAASSWTIMEALDSAAQEEYHATAWAAEAAALVDGQLLKCRDVIGALLIALKAEGEELNRLDRLVVDTDAQDLVSEREEIYRDLNDLLSCAGSRLDAIGTRMIRLRDDVEQAELYSPPSSYPSFRAFGILAQHVSHDHRTLDQQRAQLHDRIKCSLDAFVLTREIAEVDRIRHDLATISVDRWYGRHIAEHSPLPDQSSTRLLSRQLGEVSSRIGALHVTHAEAVAARDDLGSAIRRKRSAVEACSTLGVFKLAVDRCDESLSRLLDALDEATASEEPASAVHHSASINAVLADSADGLAALNDAVTACPEDPRVQFHSDRITQAWDELSGMAREEIERLATLPAHSPLPETERRQRTISASSSSSQIPRWSRKSASGTRSSPLPTDTGERSSSRLHQGLGLGVRAAAAPRIPASRASSLNPARPPMFRSLNTPTAPKPPSRRSLGASTPQPSAPLRRPNAYRPQSHRTIDRLVGSVVNKMPVRRLGLLVSPDADSCSRLRSRSRLQMTSGRTKRDGTILIRSCTFVGSCDRRPSWVGVSVPFVNSD